VLLLALVLVAAVSAQPQTTTCSGNVIASAISRPPGAMETSCQAFSTGQSYSYPRDFGGLENAFGIWRCPTAKKRVLVSNGITDHDVKQGNPNTMCAVPWYIEFPLNPTVTATRTEPASHGVIAFGLNGIPAFGAQEAAGDNAYEHAEDAFIKDAKYWYGHASPDYTWHYHTPHMGAEAIANASTLVGYALDGFGLFGPVANQSELDTCNGRIDPSSGEYRYHMRRAEQVQAGPTHGGENGYCDGTSPAINWNYVIGCYKGTLTETKSGDCSTMSLPGEDCVLEASNNLDKVWKDGKCLVKVVKVVKWWVWLIVGVVVVVVVVAGAIVCWRRRGKMSPGKGKAPPLAVRGGGGGEEESAA
jgi:hypothetical protein